MSIDEARKCIGLTVRPEWATTGAHWILKEVRDDGMCFLMTKRRASRATGNRWERADDLVQTFATASKLESRAAGEEG